MAYKHNHKEKIKCDFARKMTLFFPAVPLLQSMCNKDNSTPVDVHSKEKKLNFIEVAFVARPGLAFFQSARGRQRHRQTLAAGPAQR